MYIEKNRSLVVGSNDRWRQVRQVVPADWPSLDIAFLRSKSRPRPRKPMRTQHARIELLHDNLVQSTPEHK